MIRDALNGSNGHAQADQETNQEAECGCSSRLVLRAEEKSGEASASIQVKGTTMPNEIEFEIFKTTGGTRSDFTAEEIASVPEAKRVVFTALLEAGRESDAAEQAMTAATNQVYARVKAFQAAQATALKYRPVVTEYDAIRSHLKSIGR